nr:hypothetical protein [Tanacetum cinerariifolium]
MFNLLKGTCKSCVELEYNMDECYRTLTYQLDWANPEGHESPVDMSKPLPIAMINKVSKHKVFSTMRILSVVDVLVEERSGYGYLKEIVVRRDDQKLYKFKEGDFSDLHLNDIEDMLLLIAQNKLFNLDDVQVGAESYQRNLNLTKPQRSCLHISVKEPYTPNNDPPGIIYEDKSKKKRLMRVDEIHKFCDKTL